MVNVALCKSLGDTVAVLIALHAAGDIDAEDCAEASRNGATLCSSDATLRMLEEITENPQRTRQFCVTPNISVSISNDKCCTLQ